MPRLACPRAETATPFPHTPLNCAPPYSSQREFNYDLTIIILRHFRGTRGARRSTKGRPPLMQKAQPTGRASHSFELRFAPGLCGLVLDHRLVFGLGRTPARAFGE